METAQTQTDKGIRLYLCNINLFIAEHLGCTIPGNKYYRKPDGELRSMIPPAEFDHMKYNHPNLNKNTELWGKGKVLFSAGETPEPFFEMPLVDEVVDLDDIKISDIIIAVWGFLMDEGRMFFKLKSDNVALEIDYKNQKILLYEL